MAKELKFLFETEIKRQVEEPVVEKRNEAGQEIEIKRIVKKAKSVKVAILKPDRKLFKGAEMFYAKNLSNYLKEGLLPYSLVAKRYANDGGPLSETDKQRLKTLKEEAEKLNKDFYDNAISDAPDSKEKKQALLLRMNEINLDITNIQTAFSDIYDATAEVKARNETIEWWSLHLICVDDDGKGYKTLFGDGNYEDKIAQLEVFEDKADPFYVEVIKRLSYLVSFWFTSQSNVTLTDFKSVETLWVDKLSDYKVEEEKTEVKITETSPEKPA